ncbi:MAG: thiamine-phosphate kinase [bacterium]|nr:thiamine-phosphate kinase [bacterium]
MATELAIIKRLRELLPRIGDDAVEFKVPNIPIVSVDSFAMGEHFGDYFTPYDMGYKALAASISDIAACGGVPKYALVSIGIKNGDIDWVDNFYDGVRAIASTYEVEIIGGDITKSDTIFVSVTVIGGTSHFVRRSGAKVDDVICITGELGSSYAGLLCLKRGYKKENKLIKKHLNPLPRVKEGIKIARYANSMIDISDGLSTDLFHILEESKVSARIWRSEIPISKEIKKIAEKFHMTPESLALNGGEDFELLFTISKNYIGKAKKEVEFTEIGEIIECEMQNAKCKIIDENGNEIPVKGFDHFKE